MSNDEMRRGFRCFLAGIVVFLSSTTASFSQNLFSGLVTDAKSGEPVAGALVTLMSGTKVLSYSFTDADGKVGIDMKDTAPDLARVTRIGYSPAEIQLPQQMPVKFSLSPMKMEIKEARVRAGGIEEKGDTIVYDAAAFKDKNALTLNDILSKLPGISVSSTGTIIHNGKAINKFYVEGMDLMGSRYGVVTNNLSASDIASVEVYRKHQPVKALGGIVMSDRSAVNIVLKDDARGQWLVNGDAAVGYSDKFLFDARAMLSRFAKTNQSLFLLKGSDIGRDITKELRQMAYFGRTGAYLVSGELDNDFRTDLSPARTMLAIPEEFWNDNISGIASINHLKKTGPDSKLKFSGQFAAEKYSEESCSVEEVRFDGNDGMTIVNDASRTDRKYYFSLSGNFENNGARRFLSDEFTVTGQVFRSNSSSASVPYAQKYNLPSFKISNDLKSIIRKDASKVLDVRSSLKYVRNDHNLYCNVDSTDAEQNYLMNQLSTDNHLAFRFKAGKMLFGADAGLGLKYTDLSSNLELPDPDGNLLSGSLRIFTVSPSLRLNARYARGRNELSFEVPVGMKGIIASEGAGNRVLPVISPALSYVLRVSQNFSVNADLSYRISWNDERNLLRPLVMRSYRSFVYNDLVKSGSGSGMLSLRYEDNPDMFYATLGAAADYTRSDKTLASGYSDRMTVVSYVDLPVDNKMAGLNAMISKFFGLKTLKVELTADWNRNWSEYYLQDSRYEYTTDNVASSLSLKTSALRWLTAEVSLKYDMVRNVSNVSNSRHRLQTTGSLVILPVPKLMIEGNVYHSCWYTPDMDVSDSPVIKAAVSWKFGKFTVFAECRNILGVNELRREVTMPNRTVTYVNKLLGRQILAGIRM